MEYIPIVMVREHLRDVPQHSPPAGYRMRLYRPGDRQTWLRIWQASEPFESITDQTFDSNFGRDAPAMAARCHFLVGPDGGDVGTITAWYDRNYRSRRWGRIHWVAILPQHRGRGLSRCMMTAALSRLRTLGHRRALLTTQTPRIAAIRTYLRFGFVPDMTAKDAQRAWKLVRERISDPALADL